jgi:hypothetical protein
MPENRDQDRCHPVGHRMVLAAAALVETVDIGTPGPLLSNPVRVELGHVADARAAGAGSRHLLVMPVWRASTHPGPTRPPVGSPRR